MLNKIDGELIIEGTWEKYKDRFQNPKYIVTTFEPYDMFVKGFYKGEPGSSDERFLNIRTPDMVIINEFDEQLWLNNYKSGYGGSGPYATKSLLEELNIPGNLIEGVFSSDIYELTKNESTGEYSSGYTTPNTSIYRQNPYLNLRNTYLRNDSFRNEKIVYVQPTPIYGRDRSEEMFNFVQNHLEYNTHFTSRIKKVTIFPKRDIAKSEGYHMRDINSLNRKSSYCFIVENEEQEMWLNPTIGETTNVLYESEVIELLQQLGIILEENPKFNETIEWVKKRLLKVEAKTLELYINSDGIGFNE
ncbi:hypothetical protein [Priestia filamentosa]|uniref:hypothetical protein n=1 Tax=Priestia filamentosa TaxID=1402861 RepID=UPI002E1BEB30|nr:hypothetical protein [Priestia filamentosa]